MTRARGPTAGDAWDHVHRMFGCGDWSPDGDQPWWEYRVGQVTRLKARMTKLNLTPEEVMRCADYCKAEGIDIRNATWVTKYFYEAKRWEARRENERSRDDLEDRISQAISAEMERDRDSEWISRLMLAQGSYREEVLDEWTEWNRPRSSSPSADAARRRPGPRTA